jgi:DNA-binding transcriptional ArsR family regulator
MLAPVLKALTHPSRCSILWLLMGDRCMTPAELSQQLKLARSTVSYHVDALERAQLVTSEWSRGHRFSRLRDECVAQLLEKLALFSKPRPKPDARPIAQARRCYRHLGGQLSVQIATNLTQRGLFDAQGAHALTSSGLRWLQANGWWTADAAPTVISCLDWTERQIHFGGELGAALLSTLLRRGWLRDRPDSRVLSLTAAGRSGFEEEWGIRLAKY